MSQYNLDKNTPKEDETESRIIGMDDPLPDSPNLPAPEPLSGNIMATASSVLAKYSERTEKDGYKPTPEQLDALTWLIGIAKTEHLSMSALARFAHIDAATLSKIFTASYPAKLDNLTARIWKVRELYEQRKNVVSGQFVETSIAKKIWQVCEVARLHNALVIIYGDSHIGKTTALEEYTRRNNHGSTTYVRMPTFGNLSEYLRDLNQALGENSRGSNLYLRERPFVRLGDGKVLITDEFHQCIVTSGRNGNGIRLKTIEYQREVYDRSGGGMVICATNIFRDEVEKGRNKLVLEQLRRRSMLVLQLPSMLPQNDMDAIAESYGLPPADENSHQVRVEIIKAHGLRAYVNYLRSAGFGANKRGVKLTWRHFIAAHDALAKLSAGAN